MIGGEKGMSKYLCRKEDYSYILILNPLPTSLIFITFQTEESICWL